MTLELFTTVVRLKSITQAASREGIAASALSKRISDLEAQVGTPLFYRMNAGVELTPAGEVMMRHAQSLRELLDRIDDQMTDFSEGISGNVRIAANTSAVTQFLPEDLALFAQTYPDVAMALTERTSHEVIAAVRNGTADIGIFSEQIEDPHLSVLAYRRDTLVVITPKSPPLGSDGPVSLEECVPYEFVALQDGSSLQAFIDAFAAKANLTLRKRIEVLSFDGVRRMVEAGLGVAVLPLGAVEPYLDAADLSVTTLSEAWANRDLKIAYRDTGEPTRAAGHLLSILTGEELDNTREQRRGASRNKTGCQSARL